MLNRHDYSVEDMLLDESFVLYCLGLSQEAESDWTSWLQENPAQAANAEAARRLLFLLGIRPSTTEKEIAFAELRAAIAALKADTADVPAVKKQTAARLVLGQWAAGIAAAFLLVAAGFYWHKWTAPAMESGVLAYESYSTGDGERRQIELADGSAVILNSNSSLRIPSSYNRQERSLEVKGEAFFEVAKDPAKPFIVNNHQLAVQALGTIFKVRAYDFEPAIRVALMEGKVSLHDRLTRQAPYMLAPGDWLMVNRNDRSVQRGTFNPEDEQLWREGWLVFKDASLQEIADKLQYWYGMKVNLLTQPAKPIHFYGEFVNRSLPDVLKAIAYVNNIRIDQDRQQITILAK